MLHSFAFLDEIIARTALDDIQSNFTYLKNEKFG